MTNQTNPPPTFDSLILSGGGAKGAYGAGVAKAIEAYRKHKGLTNPVCYVGASAGALNAYMLASENADALIAFWLRMTNKRVFGVDKPTARTHAVWQVLTGSLSSKPRSLCGNDALAKLVGERARLSTIHSPLVIAATDYTRGKMRGFYVSDLLDEFVAMDATVELRRRRLDHLRRIESDRTLCQALLASTAIPGIFPPVEVAVLNGSQEEKGWFVDGGVGNNTPTREAAYFFRFLEATKRGAAGIAYCVKQDRPRTIQDDTGKFGFADILVRTLDVYHDVHTRPIINAWKRINREVQEWHAAVAKLEEWLAQLPVEPEVRQQIATKVVEDFGSGGGQAPRLDVPLLVIEPSIALGDTLAFDPERARREITHGYTDALKAISHFVDPRSTESGPLLDEAEYEKLLNLAIFAGD